MRNRIKQLEQHVAQSRRAERRGQADRMCARLEKLARHITLYQLTSVEAAELLREEAQNLGQQIRAEY